MNNLIDKIICTQDLPGERDWLLSQFPGYTSLETEFSNKWPKTGLGPGCNSYLWEIPVDSTTDLNTVSQEKFLSLYTNTRPFVDYRWCKTDKLVSNFSFGTSSLKKTAIVVTHNRCGTVFLEKMIYNDYGYKKLQNHFTTGLPKFDYQVNELCKNYLPDVFISYRDNLWDWLTSILIAEKGNYINGQQQSAWVHSFNQHVLDSISPFEVPEDKILQYVNRIDATWNSICHLRTQFPNLNFFLVEFSYLTKNFSKRYDSKISYDKEYFIKNFRELQNCVHEKYLPSMQRIQKNAIQHLRAMNCYTDLDRITNQSAQDH